MKPPCSEQVKNNTTVISWGRSLAFRIEKTAAEKQ
jgi:hypothetical protein